MGFTPADAQRFEHERIKGLRRAGELTFEPTGPGVLFDALDPAVRKWYVPQELFHAARIDGGVVKQLAGQARV